MDVLNIQNFLKELSQNNNRGGLLLIKSGTTNAKLILMKSADC
jgi:hypothetical protein